MSMICAFVLCLSRDSGARTQNLRIMSALLLPIELSPRNFYLRYLFFNTVQIPGYDVSI